MNGASARHAALMDSIYRSQRHIYDLTRKFYLLGRDDIIAAARVPENGRVLEIACGTGRNLMALARRHPNATFVGMDISKSMIETARVKAVRSGQDRRISFHVADAAELDQLNLGTFDCVVISYALSMIPAWKTVLDQAVRRLTPGGALHVVDFGSMHGLPRLVRFGMAVWLKWFHVSPRHDLAVALCEVAARHGASVTGRACYGGYAYTGRVKTSPAATTDAQCDETSSRYRRTTSQFGGVNGG
jgi:S-adenosylmethionine-diacylgycerolhomoserine-N-methlytransferase